MTKFEIIISIALYIFSFGYMVHSFGMSIKRNNWVATIIIIVAAATIGIVYFPAVFAEDIWIKLNKK